MQVAIVGLDIAKHVFQLHGVDSNSKVVLRRRLHRQEVVPFFANLTLCVVGLEACDGAHYWARRLKAAGHTVRLIAPQFVKPFVKSNKNDANDAEAMVDISGSAGRNRLVCAPDCGSKRNLAVSRSPQGVLQSDVKEVTFAVVSGLPVVNEFSWPLATHKRLTDTNLSREAVGILRLPITSSGRPNSLQI
jgi:hypothetical protein